MTRSTLKTVPLPPDRATHSWPVHVADANNGMEVPIGGAHRILLHVRNDGPTAATITIHGGDRALSPHGNGEAERVQVAPLETRFIGPIDVAAFTQMGGVIWLDFSPHTACRISAYRIDVPHLTHLH